MAKEKSAVSIYITLDSLEAKTSVPGQIPKLQDHTIPRELFPTSKEFESFFLLLRWANKHKITHACLQLGVSQFLIKARAMFKACKKEDTWSVAYGQKNVNAMKWTVKERPETKQTVAKAEESGALKAGRLFAQNLKEMGIPNESINTALTKQYGAEYAAEVMVIIEAM